MATESDNLPKAQVPEKVSLRVGDAKDVDLFGSSAAQTQETLAQERLAQDALKPPDLTLRPPTDFSLKPSTEFSLKPPSEYSLKAPTEFSLKPSSDVTFDSQFELTAKPKYDFTLKPWMIQAAEPSPLLTTRGPNLRVEDFQAAPKLNFGDPKSATDLDFRGPGLMDEERERRVDNEWRTRREKVQDRIADQIAPGLGRFEWTNGEQKFRLDYLNARSCKVRGVGVCLTVRGF